jgi:hypothetical protein
MDIGLMWPFVDGFFAGDRTHLSMQMTDSCQIDISAVMTHHVHSLQACTAGDHLEWILMQGSLRTRTDTNQHTKPHENGCRVLISGNASPTSDSTNSDSVPCNPIFSL